MIDLKQEIEIMEEQGHSVITLSTKQMKDIADRFELNAVHYLVLDSELQTALSRIDELESLQREKSEEYNTTLVSNVHLKTRNSHLESALRRLGDENFLTEEFHPVYPKEWGARIKYAKEALK